MNDFRFRFNRAIARNVDGAINWATRNPDKVYKFGKSLSNFAHSASVYSTGRTISKLSNQVDSFSKMYIPKKAPKNLKRKLITSSNGKVLKKAKTNTIKKGVVSYKPIKRKRKSHVRKLGRKRKGKGKFVYNSTFKYENGGSITDSECVYIGVGPCLGYFTQGIFRCIITDLFKEAGIQVTDLNDFIPANGTGKYTVTFFYYVTVLDTTLTNFTAGPFEAASTKIDDIAGLAVNAYRSSLTSLKSGTFVKVNLYQGDTASPAYVRASLPLSNYKIKFTQTSKIKIQNETLGNAANDNFTSVSNHPLEGYFYNVKGNGFVPHQREQVSQGGGLLANIDTGLIANSGSVLSPAHGTGYDSKFLKPPTANFFYKYPKTKKIYLNPGHEEVGVLNVEKEMYLSTLLNNIKIYNVFPSGNQWINMFGAIMFSLEHSIKTASDDQSISVAYQYEWSMKFSSQHHPFKKDPWVTVIT